MKKFVLAFSMVPLVCGQDLRISATILSPQTTKAMFGRLPSQYNATSVSVCNQTSVSQTVQLARISQQVHTTSGTTLLPMDAAISIIAQAQGSSPAATILRIGVAAVSLTAVASSFSKLSPTIKSTLTDSSLVGTQALGIVSTAIPTHVLLSLAREALPDPIVLPPLGCTSGIVLVEKVKSLGGVDFSMPLPGNSKVVEDSIPSK